MDSFSVIVNATPTALLKPAWLVTGTTPVVPVSTVAVNNNTGVTQTITISGGTLSSVVVNGSQVGTTAGVYSLPTGQGISVTYTVAPNWVWNPASVTPVFPASTVAVTNNKGAHQQVTIFGGTPTVVAINGVTIGTAAGVYYVPSGGTIAITYTGSPVWSWVKLPLVAYGNITVTNTSGVAMAVDTNISMSFGAATGGQLLNAATSTTGGGSAQFTFGNAPGDILYAAVATGTGTTQVVTGAATGV